MAKFFNKIRKQLVSDKTSVSRTSNYLKYAIGEIVLVVIGILIALSINNWNDSRKNSLREQTYYKTAINDLINDTILINEKIRNNAKSFDHNSKIRRRIHSNKATIDTVISIAQYEFHENSTPILDFNNNTFETLIASGDLSLIDPIIKDLLLTLDSEQKKIAEWMRYLQNVYRDKLGRYSDRYPIPVRNIKNKTNLEKSIWQQLDKQDFIPRFINIIDLNTFMSITNIEKLEALKIYTTDVLVKINQKINWWLNSIEHLHTWNNYDFINWI